MLELRKLPFFALSDPAAVSKAQSEAVLLLSPYQSAQEFCDRAILTPLRASAINLIHSNQQAERLLSLSATSTVGQGADQGLPAHIGDQVANDLLAFANTLQVMEELVSLMCEVVYDRDKEAGYLTADKYKSIVGTEAVFTWVVDHVAEILQACMEKQLLAAVSMYTMRFMDSSFSTADDNHDSLPGNNLNGMRLGAKLLVRVSRFYSHITNKLQEMSRPLSIQHIMHR